MQIAGMVKLPLPKVKLVKGYVVGSVQVFGCSGVQVFGCSGVRVFGCSGVRVFGCSGVQVSGVQVFRCSGVQVLKFYSKITMYNAIYLYNIQIFRN